MVHMYNSEQGGVIRSIAVPGLGAATGKTPPEICADLMWTAYNLFREKEFPTFEAMRKGLEEVLGDLGTFGDKMKTDAGKGAVLKGIGAVKAPKPAELPDEDAEDFDDSDDEDDDEVKKGDDDDEEEDEDGDDGEDDDDDGEKDEDAEDFDD